MINTIYDSITGQVLGTVTSDNIDLLNLNLQGKTSIEGNYDGNYYIDNGIAIQRSQDPSNETTVYYWDPISRTWTLDQSATAGLARAQRGQLLMAIDNITAVRYSLLTTEQQQELSAYRQALLDVPQQSSFPTEIEWPAKPAWL